MLLKAADIFEGKAAEACRRMILETSCAEQWAKFNIGQTITFIQAIAAEVANAVTGEVPPSSFGFTSIIFKEPVGPILLIPP